MEYQSWIPKILSITDEISVILRSRYHDRCYRIDRKLDDSPVTSADTVAHELLVKGLSHIAAIPILSEESEPIPFEIRREWSEYWLIDPLDGTQEFIEQRADFTCNVALIRGGVPVLGVMVAPVLGQRYWAIKGDAAYQQGGENAVRQLSVRADSMAHWLVGRRFNFSDPHWLAISAQLADPKVTVRGSALKLCLVANGDYSGCIRLEPSKEWDLAAGHCIVEAAGGCVVKLSGGSIGYNQSESLVVPPYVACASLEIARQLVT